MRPGKAARVGLAAFALGFSVAGPQSGTAAAEESADDSAVGSSVSASTPAAGEARPGRPDGPIRVQRPGDVGPGTRMAPRAAAAVAEPGRPADASPVGPPLVSDRSPGGRRVPSIPAHQGLSRPGVLAPQAVRPAPAEVRSPSRVSAAVIVLPSAAKPAQVRVTVPAAVSVGCETCRRVPGAGARPVLQGWEAASTAVKRLVDSVGRFLLAFPANPVTDFLAGALWLVRRTLLPLDVGEGLFGSAACVQTKDCSGQDLTEADLSRLVLADVDFTNAILTRADLSNSNLATGRMAGAILDGARLEGTRLTQADLTAAILTGANLKDAKLDGADLTDADLRVRNLPTGSVAGIGTAKSLRGVNLAGQDLTGVDLSGKDLTGAALTGVDLKDAKLDGADLTDADLRVRNLPTGPVAGIGAAKSLRGANLAGQNLTGVDLSGKDLTGADLTGAVLTDVVLRNAILADAIFNDADLVGAELDGVSDADLVSARWDGADLSKQDFHDRDLSGINWARVNLTDAILTGVDFAGATLTAVDLTRADLRWATFAGVSDADLVSATWTGADLSGQASFAGRNLAGIDWTDTTLRDLDLSRTALSGAVFTGVSDSDLRSVTWVGADLSKTNFANRSLTGIVWRDTTLADAILTNSDLSESNLARTILTGADLSGARLSGSTLVQTDFTDAILTGIPDSDLVSASWFETILAGQDFAGRNLAGIRWWGVNLTKADLRGTVLDGADLKDANLTQANLSNAQNLRTVLNFGTATLVNTKLSLADLREVDLTNAKLSGADLFGANLDGATLAGADLSGADLRNARIVRSDGPGVGVSDADLRSAELRGAKLNGQDLSGRDLHGVDLSAADLTGAKLIGTVLTSANLGNSNLTEADLTRAVLAYTSTTGVVWKDTTCPNGSKSSTGCSAPPGLIASDKLRVVKSQELASGDEPVMMTVVLQTTLGRSGSSDIRAFPEVPNELGSQKEPGDSMEIPDDTGDLWVDRVSPLTADMISTAIEKGVPLPVPVVVAVTLMFEGDFSVDDFSTRAALVDALAPRLTTLGKELESVEVNLTASVTGLELTNGGSGYTTPPTVTIKGGRDLDQLFGGEAATAVATVSEGKVVGLTITNPGKGYTSTPTVEFSGGNGSGATATATGKYVAQEFLAAMERVTSAATPTGWDYAELAFDRISDWATSFLDPDDPVGLSVTILIPVDSTITVLVDLAKKQGATIPLDDQYLGLRTETFGKTVTVPLPWGGDLELGLFTEYQIRYGLLAPPGSLSKNSEKDRTQWAPQAWETTYKGAWLDATSEYVVKTQAWPQIEWHP